MSIFPPGLVTSRVAEFIWGRLVFETNRRFPPGVDLLSIVRPRTGEPSGDPRVGQLEPTAAGGSAPGGVTVVRAVDGHGHVLPPASPPIEYPSPDKHNKQHNQSAIQGFIAASIDHPSVRGRALSRR